MRDQFTDPIFWMIVIIVCQTGALLGAISSIVAPQ